MDIGYNTVQSITKLYTTYKALQQSFTTLFKASKSVPTSGKQTKHNSNDFTERWEPYMCTVVLVIPPQFRIDNHRVSLRTNLNERSGERGKQISYAT